MGKSLVQLVENHRQNQTMYGPYDLGVLEILTTIGWSTVLRDNSACKFWRHFCPVVLSNVDIRNDHDCGIPAVLLHVMHFSIIFILALS